LRIFPHAQIAQSPWVPIGELNYAFAGTFDGNDHKISGLYVFREEDFDHIGLFGVITDATIKNLFVEGEIIGDATVIEGLVVGYNAGGTITRCSASGSVFSSSPSMIGSTLQTHRMVLGSLVPQDAKSKVSGR
jgi:hypothetical protein